jgi:hypothetical protein
MTTSFHEMIPTPTTGMLNLLIHLIVTDHPLYIISDRSFLPIYLFIYLFIYSSRHLM